MPTENTSLKNATPAGDSNTTNEMVTGKMNTYQQTFLIFAGSLLTLLVWIAVTGKSGDQHSKSSAQEIATDAGALADYQVDTSNLVLSKDIFGMGAISENEKGCTCRRHKPCNCNSVSGGWLCGGCPPTPVPTPVPTPSSWPCCMPENLMENHCIWCPCSSNGSCSL